MNVFKCEKGSGSFETVIGVLIIVGIVWYMIDPIVLGFKQMMLENAKMKALDQMQIEGGLTPDLKKSVVTYLKNFGFDENDIRISGTAFPVMHGNEVSITIEYDTITEEYKRTGLLSFEMVKTPITHKVRGSTTSYYYNNN